MKNGPVLDLQPCFLSSSQPLLYSAFTHTNPLFTTAPSIVTQPQPPTSPTPFPCPHPPPEKILRGGWKMNFHNKYTVMWRTRIFKSALRTSTRLNQEICLFLIPYCTRRYRLIPLWNPINFGRYRTERKIIRKSFSVPYGVCPIVQT